MGMLLIEVPSSGASRRLTVCICARSCSLSHVQACSTPDAMLPPVLPPQGETRASHRKAFSRESKTRTQ